MRHIPSIARVLTGPIFFIFGLNGFLNFIPTPPPQGIAGQFLHPVPWARTKELSFLLTPQQLRDILRRAGFSEISWDDKTAAGIEWFAQQRPPEQGKSALGLHIIMGPDFAEMAANLARNLKEGRAGLIQAIFQRR